MKKVLLIVVVLCVALSALGCTKTQFEDSSCETSTIYNQVIITPDDTQTGQESNLQQNNDSLVNSSSNADNSSSTSSNTTSVWWPDHMNTETKKTIDIKNNSTNESCANQIVIDNKKYNYVWGDEFSQNTIDYSKALYSGSEVIESGKIWDTTGMLPWFDDISIPADPNDRKKYNYVKNGELVLKAGCFDWSKYPQGDNTFNFKKVSDRLKYANGGILTTRKTMVYRQGYAEIRAKLPFKNGAWPAWWLRSTGSDLIKYPDGTDQDDPIFNLEIDVFETWTYLGNKIYPTVHKWYSNTYDPTTKRVFDYNGLDITDRIIGNRNEESYQFSMKSPRQTFDIDNPNDYHTYGFLWTDTEMTFLVDGVNYFTLDLTEPYDGYSDGKYDYNQYMYFLFDMYMMTPGATWGGTPEQRYTGTGDTTDLEMNVQYIRLWQEDGKEDIILPNQ